MVTRAVRSHGVLPLLFTRKSGSYSLRKYCIMHQLIPANPPPPTGYCGAFARLISPGGGAFANFAPPGGRAFICQPRGYSRVFDTRAVSYQNTLNIPGAYIFQRPFLRGLFLERLIFGGTYLRKEICVSKSIGLAL